MLIVLLLFAAGLFLGHLLRGRPVVRLADKLTVWCIYLLLLVMGLSIGGNQHVLSQIGTLGVQAGLLAAGAVAGSLMLVQLVAVLITGGRR